MLGPRVVLVVCAAALAGCGSNGSQPQPRIDAVDPAQAYTDRDIRLVLTGAGFVPSSFRVDPVSGQQVAVMEGFSGHVGIEPNWAPLTDFAWASTAQISASLNLEVPDDLGVGPCDVEITDPRGRKAVLPAGFLALGRDTFAPVVTVTSPAVGDLYAPGDTIHGEVTAVDQPPGQMTALTWTYTEPAVSGGSQRSPVTSVCPFSPGSNQIGCTFDVTISSDLAPGMTVELDIMASDNAVPPNQTSVNMPIVLSALPTVSPPTPQATEAGPTDAGVGTSISGGDAGL